MNMKELKNLIKNNEYKEYIISSFSDCINGILVVECSNAKNKIEEIKHYKKVIGYVIKDIKQLETDSETIEKVKLVYGLNYLFDINKNFIKTIKRLKERKATTEQIELFKKIKDARLEYESLKQKYHRLIIDEFGEVTKENFKQLQEIAKERGYFDIVNNKYKEYRKLFESFIEQFNYNPYDYNLL